MNSREERGEVDEAERGYDLTAHRRDAAAEAAEKISLCLENCSSLPVDQDGVLILHNLNELDNKVSVGLLAVDSNFVLLTLLQLSKLTNLTLSIRCLTF